MDKKRVIVEEWKAGRKEWKKKRWKKGKREKSGFWEKSFLFLFDCVFASCLFFLMHPSRPHHNTRPHSTHHTLQHGTLVHTVTCKQGRVLVLQRTHGPFQQSCDDVILFFAITVNFILICQFCTIMCHFRNFCDSGSNRKRLVSN